MWGEAWLDTCQHNAPQYKPAYPQESSQRILVFIVLLLVRRNKPAGCGDQKEVL
jgi:hypothetical protein